MSKVQIVDISTEYIESLSKYLSSQGSNILPYENKKVGKTPFTRPYVCLKYSNNYRYIECYPFSSYKKKDNLKTPYYCFIVVNGMIRGKIILNCKLIVPRDKTRIIRTTPDAIKNCPNKSMKDYLRTLQDEWQFCHNNLNWILSESRRYIQLQKAESTKYNIINIDLVQIFNKKLENKKG